MNKFSLSLAILISCEIVAQNTEIKAIDRFENNKNDWGIIDNNEELCKIYNGKLIIENRRKNKWTYFASENIKNLENKTYSEISFDFKIDKKDLDKGGGVGFLFINDENSKGFEYVRLLIQKDKSYFKKYNTSYPEAYFYLTKPFKTPNLIIENNVKIILDNRTETSKNEHLQLYINNELIYNGDWPILNFNKTGFLSYGLHKSFYDNLIIKQSKETVNAVDVFDLGSYGGKLEIDRNGIKLEEILNFIPPAIAKDYNGEMSTVDLISKLKFNPECNYIGEDKVIFGKEKRNIISFSYNEVLIEFFTDKESPNPITLNFLEKSDLDSFFELYKNYNSYRDEGEVAISPFNSSYSIFKYYESLQVMIWKGMK